MADTTTNNPGEPIVKPSYADIAKKLEALEKLPLDQIYDKLSELAEQFRLHVENSGDAHGTDKDDVGLGQVANYPVATVEEAKDGSSNMVLMTPHLTNAMIAEKSLTTDGLDELVNAMTTSFKNAGDIIKNV